MQTITKRGITFVRLAFFIILFLTFGRGAINAQTSSGTGPQCPTLPTNVNIQINHYVEWPGNHQSSFSATKPFEDYVWGVALGELAPTIPAYAGDPWAGDPWDKQAIRALSIAARTAGSYKCNSLTDDSPQQYRPYRNAVNGVGGDDPTRFQNNSNFTKGMYVTWDGLRIETPYNGVLLDAQHRSDTGLQTCSWSTGSDNRAHCLRPNGTTVAGYDYLTSNDNQYGLEGDFLGPGPGFGQISAHIWRKNGDRKASYSDLLHKSYTGIYIQNDNNVSYTRQFYNNYNSLGCQGSVISQSTVKTINDFWPGSPATNVNADNFCTRWTGTVNLTASGWYTVYILRDDGMKVWVDNSLVLDAWSNSSSTLDSVSLYLTSGSHALKIDHYDSGYDAVARFSLTRGIGMIGKYFNRIINLSEMPNDYVMIRPDILSQFDWVTASPLDPSNLEPTAPSISSNNFSVIWQGRLYMPGDENTCEYIQFKARVDDGGYVKMYDDPYGGGAFNLITNAWIDQGPTSYDSNPRWLCGGPGGGGGTYRVEARYYERTVGAVARFWWIKTTSPGDENEFIEP